MWYLLHYDYVPTSIVIPVNSDLVEMFVGPMRKTAYKSYRMKCFKNLKVLCKSRFRGRDRVSPKLTPQQNLLISVDLKQNVL